ncbi:MAG: UbiA family prenyltransferase [Desulfovibrio sp.]|nr:UbiA family prenyltransferase [Desulfovibrio sp.]
MRRLTLPTFSVSRLARHIAAAFSAFPRPHNPSGQFFDICRMIKIEHSIFALPYAWAGAFLAARQLPSARSLIFLTIAMIAVRSFAMAFNRLVDLPFDRDNPRTRNRPLVTGAISVQQTRTFCWIMAIIFVLACAMLNMVCLCLAVPALLFAAAYSLLKRCTMLCHFWLGATLGLAPLAGWLSVTPAVPGLPVVLLSCAVLFWVAAFDIYYSFQDIDFDTAFGLYSAPVCCGSQGALLLAGFSHVMTSIFLLLTGFAAGLSWPWYALWLGISVLLFMEHRLMQPQDLRYVDTAFFTLNAIISPVVLLGVLLGIYL